MKQQINIQEKFGQRVRSFRKIVNLSIEDLALIAGLNKNYLSDVERGKRNISLQNIKKIADAFGISVDLLFID